VKSILACLCLVLPVVASAGNAGPITISGNQLQIISNPQIAYLYVNISGGGCPNINAGVLIMDSSNPAAASMYATLLTAKTSGGQITISTMGCSGGYPIINSIYLD